METPFPEEPQLPHTGQQAVDEALEPLTRLVGKPVAEHVEIYDQVHAGLKGALSDLT